MCQHLEDLYNANNQYSPNVQLLDIRKTEMIKLPILGQNTNTECKFCFLYFKIHIETYHIKSWFRVSKNSHSYLKAYSNMLLLFQYFINTNLGVLPILHQN